MTAVNVASPELGASGSPLPAAHVSWSATVTSTLFVTHGQAASTSSWELSSTGIPFPPLKAKYLISVLHVPLFLAFPPSTFTPPFPVRLLLLLKFPEERSIHDLSKSMRPLFTTLPSLTIRLFERKTSPSLFRIPGPMIILPKVTRSSPPVRTFRLLLFVRVAPSMMSLPRFRRTIFELLL